MKPEPLELISGLEVFGYGYATSGFKVFCFLSGDRAKLLEAPVVRLKFS